MTAEFSLKDKFENSAVNPHAPEIRLTKLALILHSFAVGLFFISVLVAIFSVGSGLFICHVQ